MKFECPADIFYSVACFKSNKHPGEAIELVRVDRGRITALNGYNLCSHAVDYAGEPFNLKVDSDALKACKNKLASKVVVGDDGVLSILAKNEQCVYIQPGVALKEGSYPDVDMFLARVSEDKRGKVMGVAMPLTFYKEMSQAFGKAVDFVLEFTEDEMIVEKPIRVRIVDRESFDVVTMPMRVPNHIYYEIGE